MNSRQLHWILSGNKFTKQFFKGVYAIDEIKSIKTVSYPSSFVINLDPSYKPGSHWVAVYFDKNGVGEYFDSFARYPPHEIVHFLRSHAKGWQYNRMQHWKNYKETYYENILVFKKQNYFENICFFFFK